MAIYLVEHKSESFSGYFGGVDFHHGRGSTGSKADARRLASLGYRVHELGAERAKQGTEAEGGAPAPPPVDLSPTPEEIERARTDEEARKSLDEKERDPDSDWSKTRKARAKKRTGGRRRKS